MENENKGVEEKKEDLTPTQDAPTEEKKEEKKLDDQPVEVPEEEKVTLSKKELEDLKKRADDYNRSIELKRIMKLEKKDIKPEDGTDVTEELNKLREELSTFKAQSFNSNLSEAYREFVKDNPWANDDAKFDKIKEKFSSVGTETKDELFSQLKSAAQSAFPDEYEKHLEEKIKAKVLTDKTISNGSAGPATNLHTDTNNIKTPEEKMKEKMEALFKASRATGR